MYNIITTKHRLGEKRTANNGLVMTIVEYNSSMNISVQFETGEIVRNKTYSNFTRGNIGLPNKQRKYGHILEIERATSGSHIGDKVTRPDGTTITIIAFRNSADLDVQFDDGTIVSHRTWQMFNEDKIQNPNKPRKYCVTESKIGETILHQLGISMKIIEYKNTDNITVQFDSGYQRHCSYSNFKRGKIKHAFPYTMGNITLIQPAYVFNGVGNFICTCNECHLSDVMTLEEMRKHKCKK